MHVIATALGEFCEEIVSPVGRASLIAVADHILAARASHQITDRRLVIIEVLLQGPLLGRVFYSALAARGFFPIEQLKTFMDPLSMLNGHPDRNKLPGIEANTGPLGHGLPIAVGAALGARMQHQTWRVFVLTGDGELQEGSNWEAAMTAQHYGLDNLIVIVDRNRIQQGDFTEKTLRMEPLAERWRAFGFAVEEVDGHNPVALLEQFSAVPIELGKPSCVIASTIKGKGVSFAENQPAWHHGVPTREQLAAAAQELRCRGELVSRPGNITATAITEKPTLFDCRDAYSSALEEMAAQDQRVCAVITDSLSSTKLKNFKAKYPDRFINVGIAEQNMVGVGCGLANSGMIPYLCAASCFMTARAMEQIKVDLSYSKTNVRLCGMSPGMAYGQLGPTHHSVEDIAWTRVIPNLSVIVPADHVETSAAMRYSLRHEGPIFLRISRMPVPQLHSDDYEFQFGNADILRDGDDVTLIATGVLVARAMEAANALELQGVSARVVNISTIKPLDREAILDAARTARAIVTAEEGLAAGGLGGAVAELLATEHPTRMRMLGVPDVFAPTGSADFLLEHFGLTAMGIYNAAIELIGK